MPARIPPQRHQAATHASPARCESPRRVRRLHLLTVFGGAAGGAAVAAGLSALVDRGVEVARAEPAAAAQDEAVGVVGAGAR